MAHYILLACWIHLSLFSAWFPSTLAHSIEKKVRPPRRTAAPFPLSSAARRSKRKNPAASTTLPKVQPRQQHSSFRSKPRESPSLETQLSLERNGHAVLRSFLRQTSPLFVSMTQQLQARARNNELLAWQQKVHVATSDRQPVSFTASSLDTVDACRKQLEHWGITDLPFLQYFNNWRHLPIVHSLCLELAETAAQLLNVSSVRLYQDALFWKRASDGPTPWHADAKMVPIDTNRMLTVWIPLSPSVIQSTGLVFASQTHNDFSLAYWYPKRTTTSTSSNDKKSKNPWNRLDERYRDIVDYMPLHVGDATVHAGWTLHCANPGGQEYHSNNNDEKCADRWALAITYVDAHAPVLSDETLQYYADHEDDWSYQDWIHQVPRQTRHWNHPLVPIIWPQKGTSPKQPKNEGKTRQ